MVLFGCVPKSWPFGYRLSPQQCMRLASGETVRFVLFYGHPFVSYKVCTLNTDGRVLVDCLWPKELQSDHFALLPDEDRAASFLHPFWSEFGRRIRRRGGEDLFLFTEQDGCSVRTAPMEIPSPHFYDSVTIVFRRSLSWLAIDPVSGWPSLLCFAAVARRRRVQALLNHGIVIGEVGVCWMGAETDAAFETTFCAIESNLTPAAFLWCYVPGHTLDDGWNRENFSIWSQGRLRVSRAVRPYAMRVAGCPIRMLYENGLFVLEFESGPGVNSIDTEIYLRNGACESVWVSDGEWTMDAPNHLIHFRHALTLGVARHSVHVRVF